MLQLRATNTHLNPSYTTQSVCQPKSSEYSPESVQGTHELFQTEQWGCAKTNSCYEIAYGEPAGDMGVLRGLKRGALSGLARDTLTAFDLC